jgi:aminoglycoside phosphotransferase (APT) family kinase protein
VLLCVSDRDACCCASLTDANSLEPSDAAAQTAAMPTRMHADEVDVDEALVRALITDQMPALAGLPLRVVTPWGTDNAIWRLGDDLVVRLPRIHWAAGQVDKEARWLPALAPHLPIAVPVPVGVGEPGEGFPFRWAVHRWLHGQGATLDAMGDPQQFALDLAAVVRSLWSIPTDGAPPPHNRAQPVQDYDADARRVINGARDLIDEEAALSVWEQAIEAPRHEDPPVWVHGDIEGNCLVLEGRLSGIVDWGSACAGDPAVDVQVAWSPLFDDVSRAVFLHELAVDEATIRRAKGAAVQQACAALPYYVDTYPEIVERSRHKLQALGVGTR